MQSQFATEIPSNYQMTKINLIAKEMSFTHLSPSHLKKQKIYWNWPISCVFGVCHEVQDPTGLNVDHKNPIKRTQQFQNQYLL